MCRRVQAGSEAPDLFTQSSFESGSQTLRVNASRRTFVSAPLVEIDSGMEVRTRHPWHHGEVPVRSLRNIRGPRGGRLQQRPPMRFERATEISATPFDPESDHVEDLTPIHVAEVDCWASLAAPSGPRCAGLLGHLE